MGRGRKTLPGTSTVGVLAVTMTALCSPISIEYAQ